MMGSDAEQVKPQLRKQPTAAGLPIDTGWAWVIMAASCGIFGLQSGSFKASGILYVELKDHFQSDSFVTLWVTSAYGLFSLSAGPFVSIILQKTSHRFITMLGAVCTAGGIAATGFVPSVEWAYLTISLLYGFGMTCLNISGLTCTIPYFNRHRGLAVGVTGVGGGIMSFIIPNVLRVLFDTFAFDGAMIIYGGIFLHALVFAALLRPLTTYFKRPRQCSRSRDNEVGLQSNEDPLLRPRVMKASDERPYDDAESPDKGAHVRVSRVSIADVDLAASVYLQEAIDDALAEESQEKTKKVRRPVSSGGRKGSFDFSLLKDERMWIIGLVMFFSSNGTCLVFSAMAPFGDSIGLTRQTTSMLIAIGGAFEIVFRGLQGWFSDQRIIPSLVQLGICSGLTGVSSALCPIIGGEVGIGLLAAMCGAAGTSIYLLVTVVIRELLGNDKMTSAVGIQMLFQASSFVVTTLVAGYLTETTGSWRLMFYYIGGNMMFASALCMVYTLVVKSRAEKKTPM